ncbi:MAG: HAD-IB family hydrolase [Akkermansiaceae bacterium]|nr:HAD-IB family hydrolase [Akkermansiaceae bacterium]
MPLKPQLPAEPPVGVALFDLDGTLLAWDCQLLFRHHVLRREPWRAVFLPLFLLCLPFYKILGDQALKRVFLAFLTGMKPAELAAHARRFAQAVRPAIYQELRDRLDDHRRQGHLLILASASPEFYVSEIGEMLGFDLVLGTPVTTTPRFPFLPVLQNHKGAAKVRRLTDLLPSSYFTAGKLVHSHGYTDSSADLPMLAICRDATVVNPSPALAALAADNGWDVVRPRRPWTSAADHAWRTLALLFGIGRDPGGLGG